MRTIVLLIAAIGLFAAACGGDDDVEPTVTQEPTSSLPTATAEPTAIPTPTPLPATADALTVVFNQTTFVPTVAEFALLPQTEIELPGGEIVTGVSIGELAALVEASGARIVTVEGQQIGSERTGFMRQPLVEVADDAVIYLTDAGQLMLVGATLAELEWLTAVRSVTFE